jgi:hypothetical protein
MACMKKTIFFWLLLASLSMSNAAGQDMSDTSPALEFPVRKLNFIFVALSQLKKDQPKANLDRMNVAVEEFDDTFEIHFSPDREKVTVKENGDLMVMTIPNPRGNEFGKSVTYVLSKPKPKILRTTYSR